MQGASSGRIGFTEPGPSGGPHDAARPGRPALNGGGPNPALGDGERLGALERENRELRREIEALRTALARAGGTVPPATAPPGSETGSAAVGPEPPPAGPLAGPGEGAGAQAALEGEAPWETVLVPRGTMR